MFLALVVRAGSGVGGKAWGIRLKKILSLGLCKDTAGPHSSILAHSMSGMVFSKDWNTGLCNCKILAGSGGACL